MYIDQYTDEVKKHFLNPHNMGKITVDDLKEGEILAQGTVGNPACGDLLTVYLRIKDGRIKECKVETFGCASAIACSSVTTDLAIGKSIEDAKSISKKDAADALGGLPPIKMHCSNLAAEALHAAIANYEKGVVNMSDDQKQEKKDQDTTKSSGGAITKDMLIGDVVQKYPDAGGVMMEFGLHCLGCRIANHETVEQGAMAHGLESDQIDQMVKKMNETIK